ncbi:hypothetical protein [Streptomyces tsukubensis]|uniref:Uncharacterized protein n=1 Tax=Streptomyces tsukubensis TaxID=83656 RepID=A0A1V4A6H8_9ACTN|nr:hypothetical protein [Streptomyces tsukubensis]OON77284.1 hypothetical protein B1H18_18705 [Streptomyces tsukubensis]QFR92359.1 hypothetical protein GBW32_03930 [Streptomyces tsukubensis]
MTDDQQGRDPHAEQGLSEAYAEERRRARMVLAARAEGPEDLALLLDILDLRPAREPMDRPREPHDLRGPLSPAPVFPEPKEEDEDAGGGTGGERTGTTATGTGTGTGTGTAPTIPMGHAGNAGQDAQRGERQVERSGDEPSGESERAAGADVFRAEEGPAGPDSGGGPADGDRP